MVEIIRLAKLATMFKIKDLGVAKQISGMDIHKYGENAKLWLSQQKYLKNIFKNFGKNIVKPIKIPLASHLLSSSLYPSNKEENDYVSHV